MWIYSHKKLFSVPNYTPYTCCMITITFSLWWLIALFYVHLALLCSSLHFGLIYMVSWSLSLSLSVHLSLCESDSVIEMQRVALSGRLCNWAVIRLMLCGIGLCECAHYWSEKCCLDLTEASLKKTGSVEVNVKWWPGPPTFCQNTSQNETLGLGNGL